MCIKPLLKGTLLGGIAFFVVSCGSWMGLPFHMNSFHMFKDSPAVLKSVQENSAENGVYMLPGMTKECKEKGCQPMKFTAIVVTNPAGCNPSDMPMYMLREFVIDLLAALLLTALLLQGKSTALKPVLKTSLLAGFILTVVAYLPNMNWWHFPLDFTLPSMIDTVVATLLAGFLIGKFALPKASADMTP